MKTLSYALAAALLLTMLAPSASAQRRPTPDARVREFVAIDAPVVVLTGVRVIDGTGAPAQDDQAIVVRDGLIASVESSASILVPEGAQVLELNGHTVFPGIVGMHNHLGYGWDFNVREDARLYLAGGVTTIRVTGNRQPYADLSLKREIDEGRYPGPRVHSAGPYLPSDLLETPQDVRRFVNYWADEGVTWIKVYTRIRRRELAAAIEEAHARGIKVTGHLCAVTTQEAAELGIDNIEHGPDNTDFDPQKQPDVCSSDSYPNPDPESEAVIATIRALVANDVAVTATLPEAESYEPHRPATPDPRVMDFMEPATLAVYRDRRARIDATAPAGYLAWLQAIFRSFVAAGGLLVAGVDPVFPGLLPGFADQRNYELLVETGFAPEHALRIMTANGAQLLGVDDILGTVQPGKVADLVVVRGDPITDLTATRNIVFVFKDGIAYDSAKLLASVRRGVSGGE